MLRTRSAAEYADFLLPHLDAGFHVLDAGCGAGTITVGLAERLTGGRVVGVDPSGDGFSEALRYAEDNGIGNVDLHVGDAYALDFPSDRFDACLCHSTLETLGDPLAGLVEIKRTLKPAGVLGVACVEYGGLILAGPGEELLLEFYALRERLWRTDGHADPYRGRRLRGLLEAAGFDSVLATSKYWSYGTPEAVRSFGRARAEDCGDGWYRSAAVAHGYASDREIDAMRAAWLEWSESPGAYLSFAWCRALGWNPR